MKLFTKNQLTKLRVNYLQEGDHKPVVKLFNPAGAGTWLLTEINDGVAFGLCDMGFGCPELGYVSIEEITSLRLPMGLKIERDLSFKAEKTLSQYAEDARKDGYIAA